MKRKEDKTEKEGGGEREDVKNYINTHKRARHIRREYLVYLSHDLGKRPFSVDDAGLQRHQPVKISRQQSTTAQENEHT